MLYNEVELNIIHVSSHEKWNGPVLSMGYKSVWAAMWENQECGFRTSPTPTELYSHRRRLEAWNFGFKKKRNLLSMQRKERCWWAMQLLHGRSASLFSPPMHDVGFLIWRLISCSRAGRSTFEPYREKTGTAKLISAFVFATPIVQFFFYLNLKFQAFSSFLWLYRSVCVGPGRKPHCWFSHEAAQFLWSDQ